MNFGFESLNYIVIWLILNIYILSVEWIFVRDILMDVIFIVILDKDIYIFVNDNLV